MVEIGKREGVGKRYVTRLAFLAPTIIKIIVEGRQPPELTAQFLPTGRGDLPLSWQAQEKLLGFRRSSLIAPPLGNVFSVCTSDRNTPCRRISAPLGNPTSTAKAGDGENPSDSPTQRSLSLSPAHSASAKSP
jgi:hypothetical protein